MAAARSSRAGSAAALLVLLAVMCGTAAAAGVYKWIDARGVVHYDDTYVIGTPLTQATLDRRVIAARTTLKVPKDFVAEVARRCGIERERLANFRGATAMFGQDPSGNVYPLSPAQMRLTVLETDRDMQRYCGRNAADTLYAEQVAEARQAADDTAKRKAARR